MVSLFAQLLQTLGQRLLPQNSGSCVDKLLVARSEVRELAFLCATLAINPSTSGHQAVAKLAALSEVDPLVHSDPWAKADSKVHAKTPSRPACADAWASWCPTTGDAAQGSNILTDGGFAAYYTTNFRSLDIASMQCIHNGFKAQDQGAVDVTRPHSTLTHSTSDATCTSSSEPPCAQEEAWGEAVARDVLIDGVHKFARARSRQRTHPHHVRHCKQFIIDSASSEIDWAQLCSERINKLIRSVLARYPRQSNTSNAI